MNRRELERTILEALAERPRYVVDLAATIDEHPVTVEQACERLYAAEEIRSIGSRRYDISATGRRRLADAEPVASGTDVRTGTEGRP